MIPTQPLSHWHHDNYSYPQEFYAKAAPPLHPPSTNGGFHHHVHFHNSASGRNFGRAPRRLIWFGLGSLVTYWYFRRHQTSHSCDWTHAIAPAQSSQDNAGQSDKVDVGRWSRWTWSEREVDDTKKQRREKFKEEAADTMRDYASMKLDSVLAVLESFKKDIEKKETPTKSVV